VIIPALLDSRITTYPDREAWMADARDGAPDYTIGASTAYRMLCGAFGGLWGVIEEARHGVKVDLAENEAVQLGNLFEPIAKSEYARVTGFETFDPGYHRIGSGWLRVSPDLWARDDEGIGLVDTKIPIPSQMPYWNRDRGASGTRGDLLAPERYEVQGLVQCTAAMLAGVEVAWFEPFAWWGPHMHARPRYRFTREQLRQCWSDLSALRSAYLVGDDLPAVDDSDECKRVLMRDWSAEGVGPCPDDLRPVLDDLSSAMAQAASADQDKALAYNRARSAWPDGLKTVRLDDGSKKPPQATMSASGKITLTRWPT